MGINNNLPGGFSKVTLIIRTATEATADNLAVIARGVINIARLDKLMNRKEGGRAENSPDLRAGQSSQGQRR